MKVAFYDTGTGRITRRMDAVPEVIAYQSIPGEEFFLNCPDSATHIIDGEPVQLSPPDPPATAAQQIMLITRAIQTKLDIEAQSRKYDGILSLVSYAGSTNQRFRSEAMAAIEWRDACWEVWIQRVEAVEAGTAAMPTVDEILSELPELVWPE